MNDERLIEIVQQKTPEELSLDEIELLRSRMAESSEVRRVLLEQLQLEEYLADALGRVNVSVDEVLAKANPQRATVMGALVTFGTMIAVLAVAGVAATALLIQGEQNWFWSSASASDPPPNGRALAAHDDEPARDDSSQEQDAGGAASRSDDHDTTRDAPGGAGDAGELAPGATGGTDDTTALDDHPSGDPGDPLIARGAPGTPWRPILQAAPLSFYETWTTPIGGPRQPVSLADVKKWFEEVPTQPASFTEKGAGSIKYGAIDGIARLKAPLADNTMLRWTTGGEEPFAIHTFSGDRGVSIYRHADGTGVWSAYTTQREPGAAVPKTFTLCSTDAGRASRTEVRYLRSLGLTYQRGEIVLFAGDIELLRASLGDSPARELATSRLTLSMGLLVRCRPEIPSVR